MTEAPFDPDNFLAELLGEELTVTVELEKVIRALALVPIDFEFKKYALIQDLDRRGVKLELWMVTMLRGES